MLKLSSSRSGWENTTETLMGAVGDQQVFPHPLKKRLLPRPNWEEGNYPKGSHPEKGKMEVDVLLQLLEKIGGAPFRVENVP